RRRHTRSKRDWSSDVCSSDLFQKLQKGLHQSLKSLETRLKKLEEVEKPEEDSPIKMTLPNERSFKNKTVVRAEKVAGEISNQKLWNPTTFFLKGGDKVGIIGPNGSGKTTLLKKILDESDSDIYLSPKSEEH